MNVEPEPCMHQDLKVTATTIRSMDIEPLSVDLSLCDQKTNWKRQEVMDTSIIGITILGNCQEYGKIPENCIRKHFSGNYNRWLSQTTCFSYLKIGHIRKHFPKRSKAPNSEFDKGKRKEDVEDIRGEMNKTWKKRDGCSTSNGAGITSPNRSSGHISSN